MYTYITVLQMQRSNYCSLVAGLVMVGSELCIDILMMFHLLHRVFMPAFQECLHGNRYYPTFTANAILSDVFEPSTQQH